MGSHRAERRGIVLRWAPPLAVTLAVIAVAIIVSRFHGPRPVLAAPSADSRAAQQHTPVRGSSTPAASPRPAALPGSAVSPTPARPAAPSPCRSNTDPQQIIVRIGQQHAWMCAGARQVMDSAVTTGAAATGAGTPTGTWHIVTKQTDTTLTVLTGEAFHVDYWLPYDGNVYGFHDSSWQTFPYGSQRYRTDGSHGCVHLPLAAMRWLYNWAHVGATVTIRY